MVLVNTRAGSATQDLHAVPTVHLTRTAAKTLPRPAGRPRSAAGHAAPGPRACSSAPGRRLVVGGRPGGDRRQAGPGGSGDRAAGVDRPDHERSRLGPRLGHVRGHGLDERGGRRALSRHHRSEAAVRSALIGTASPVPGSVLRTGAGAPALGRALRARLVHPVPDGAYRAWLVGAREDVNTPSLLARGSTTLTRRVTNLGRRPGTWSVSVTGIERYSVSVSPATLTLRPGESARYRVTVGGGSLVGGLDDGAVVWRGDRGDVVRVPLAITR